MIGAWFGTISHPGAADELTAASYGIAAVLCAWAWYRAGRARDRFGGWFWTLSGLSMMLSAGNELLDLQTLLTMLVRADAVAGGWYDQRRGVQLVFVIALVASAAAGATAAWWHTKGRDRGIRVALIGVLSIAVFFLLRATSFHHVDQVLGQWSGNGRWASIQEIAGIAAVSAGSAMYGLRARWRDH